MRTWKTWPQTYTAPPAWEYTLAKALLEKDPSIFLCFGVPLTSLGEASEEKAPCLVCREEELLLSLAPRGTPAPVLEDVPALCLQTNDASAGSGAVLRWLEKDRRPEGSRRRHGLRPLDERDSRKLTRQRLAVPGDNGWIPGDYGEAQGLLRCARFQRGRVRQVPCASPRWKGIPASPELWQRRPLEERLERLRRGESSNPGYSLALAKRLAETSIEDYFQDLPDKLAKLEAADIRGYDLYQEAAYRVHCLLQKPETRETGWRMMQLLAEPILNYVRERRGKG